MSLKTIAGGILLTVALFGQPAEAQTRVDFHLLPAVSTGPLDPDWHPDGAVLAYAARGDIWTIAADGGEAVAVTEGPAYHSEPAFSPDGRSIAFTSDTDGNLDIGIVDVASGRARLLTSHPELDFAPAWSADGQYLYFVSRRNGDLDILRMELETGDITDVVTGKGNQYQPAVSPDNQSLAYVAPVRNRSGSGGIWVRPLTDGEPALVHYEESSYRLKPQWSADGRTLYYDSDAAGSNDIAVVPANGGNRVRLTEEAGGEFDPAVSPDGTRIAFVSNHAGPTRLYTMSSAGGERKAWRSVAVNSRTPRFATGTVRGRILDAGGTVTPARLMLTASDGRAYAEDGGFHRMVPATRTHYQHSDGTFEIEVPTGPLAIAAMRGFEFAPASTTLEIVEDAVIDVDLELQRIDDPRSHGWYAGDMHVHDLHEGRQGISHEDFFQQLHADDVGVANALIHMDGTKIMGRWDDLTGKPSPLSNGRTILRYSQEFRGAFGHIGLVGVNEFIMPMIAGAPNTPFAWDSLGVTHVDGVREQGGIAGFVHPYNNRIEAPEDAGNSAIPVLAALGKGDFYDVVSVASLEPDSTAMYYRLLNSGIRIAATGGTDNFSDVWYDPSGGAARTYARLENGEALDFSNWLSAVRNGRTFASSGPLLFLSVDGRQPGDEIFLDGDHATSLDVTVELASMAALELVEIVANGRVIESWNVRGDGPAWRFDASLDLPEGGWVTARATGPASPYVGDAFAFAQTSPVYVLRDGKSFSSAADAQFLLRAIDDLWRRVSSRDSWFSAKQESRYKNFVEEARRYYRNIVLAHPEDTAFQERAPDTFAVVMQTSKGSIELELHRDWAPRGVDRFYNLVRNGYYDDSRVFRVRDKDFVQFGIHGKPAVAQAWRHARIADDPVRQSNRRGTIAFAMGTDPNDRTTQVYINLRDKPELDEMGFAVMGEVVSGMQAADALYSGYAESAAGGIRGGKQDVAFEAGNAFFDDGFPLLDRIIDAKIVPPTGR